jgi:hypothetical protein
MNVLDENFPESQRQLLRGWRIPIRQIGYEVGRKGMKEEFDTEARRMAAVIRISQRGLAMWRLYAEGEIHLGWSD